MIMTMILTLTKMIMTSMGKSKHLSTYKGFCEQEALLAVLYVDNDDDDDVDTDKDDNDKYG